MSNIHNYKRNLHNNENDNEINKTFETQANHQRERTPNANHNHSFNLKYMEDKIKSIEKNLEDKTKDNNELIEILKDNYLPKNQKNKNSTPQNNQRESYSPRRRNYNQQQNDMYQGNNTISPYNNLHNSNIQYLANPNLNNFNPHYPIYNPYQNTNNQYAEMQNGYNNTVTKKYIFFQKG